MARLVQEDLRPEIATHEDERAAIALRLHHAAPTWANSPLVLRSKALTAVADRLVEDREELISIAALETGLSEARLEGELKRTVVQIELFADTMLAGDFLDVRIDERDPEFVLGVRPDLRRYLVPVGPVLNFAASNFPFAFSVVGGDTVSALAAGCPVVVKAHPGHPQLSRQLGLLTKEALEGAGAPEGVFAVISGVDVGIEMLKDPRIAAASFTGSTRAGKFLARIAADREAPIPFFGEMGSLNPVIVTAGAMSENMSGIAQGFVGAISGSAGQLCTKPGVLFVPAGTGFDHEVVARLQEVSEHRTLYPGLGRAYEERRNAILETQGVVVLHRGSVRIADDQEVWVTPTLVKVTLDTLKRQSDVLLDEAFGPLSVIVEYHDAGSLLAQASPLFAGSLTGTLHAAQDEDTVDTRRILAWLTSIAGRVLFGGWPTGVAVSPAMEHGGPWPATTNAATTSVGTAAIQRFLRPVTYQDVPEALLPEAIRTSNPWSVPRRCSAAGDSRTWGDLSRKLASRSFGSTSDESDFKETKTRVDD